LLLKHFISELFVKFICWAHKSKMLRQMHCSRWKKKKNSN